LLSRLTKGRSNLTFTFFMIKWDGIVDVAVMICAYLHEQRGEVALQGRCRDRNQLRFIQLKIQRSA
jgi:hypothetical protein